MLLFLCGCQVLFPLGFLTFGLLSCARNDRNS